MIRNKIMYHNVRIIPFLLFLLFSFEIYGQSENSFNPKITPPSPTAYELGRYGQTDVGTFTGTPNISVPLYTYKTRNLSIPISLGYNSNGIQVDQMETNVGLGWNLNAGGIINRVVRGKPDEERYYPINEDNCFSSSFITYMDANQFNDTQPDLYSYNFNGHSGQFVFDKNNKVVLIPQNNLKIEPIEIDLKKGFRITTDDGVEYYFFDKEYSTWENTDAPSTVLTGWYLSKVIHPAGDIINFTYKDTNYSFTSNISYSLPVKMSEQTKCPNGPTVNLWEQSSVNILSVMGKMIDSISSTEPVFGTLSFQHIANPNMIGNFLIKGYQVTDNKQNIIESTVFNYLFPNNKRIFLSECIFKDTSKKYSFEYENPEGLPGRLSNAKDLWGFCNGKGGIYPDPGIHIDLYSLNSLVVNAVKQRSIGDKRAYIDYAKRGILKKIIYPTKGYNEFIYESNTVVGTITSPLEIANGDIRLYNHGDGSAELNDSFEFENKKEYEGEIEATIISDGNNSGNDTFPEGDVFIKVLVENLTNPGENITFYTTAYNKPNSKSYKFLANTAYKISVSYTPGIQTTARVSFTYCAGGGIESTGNIPVGGLRIQEIKTFDTDSNKTDVKHYYYGSRETPNVSSGVEGVEMNLFNSTSINTVCAPTPGEGPSPFFNVGITHVMTLHPNSIYQLYRSNGNSSTTYRNVTVSHGGANYENGGEEFFYYASSDTKPSSCINNTINSAPWTNSSWDNGVLEKKIIFNDKLIDLNIIENKYKLEEQYTQEVVGLAYDFKFNPVIFYSPPNPKAIEHLNVAKYATNSYWFYLESEKNTQNDVAGSNPVITTTTYKYNNPLHKKLSSQTTTNSIGEEIETKYFYPQDPEMATETLRNELIAKNMIGVVLDTQTLREGTKLSEQKTIYDQSSATSNLLLPRSIGVNKGVNAVDLSLDKKITYDQYDEKGNILQYTLESGIPVSIIWGYNKTQPIAKIENLAYNLIPSGTIANLQTLSNADTDNCMSGSCTEQLLRNGLNAFRNSLPNAFISTYTYNPLVGVTSVTDPKGISSYYEYNTYGRLKFVKDKDLNVLQKYCYNYKGQQVDCSDNDSTSVILYKSSARSGSFTKNNCSSSGVGATVVYSQVEGASTSTISQADADAKGLDKFTVDGQVYANTNPSVKCTFKNTAQSRLITRNNCAAGGNPASVWYTVAAGIYTSDVSQAAADAQAIAQIDNNGQAFANNDNNAKCTFKNTAQSRLITRNNCAEGGSPASVWYTVAAGIYTSDVSQTAADAQAIAEIDNNGQAFANNDNNAKCTFWNTAQSRLMTRNNCATGGSPASVWYTVAAGIYHSDVSQTAADAQAVTEIDNNGQAFVNNDNNAKCTFWNTAQSRLITRNNCAAGGSPASVWYTVAAGIYHSDASQAAADAQAVTEIDNNGQAFANSDANAKCTFWNAAQSRLITRNNCAAGGSPASVWYTVAPGIYHSDVSQAEADAQAVTEIDNNGQAFANSDANAKCTFWNTAISGSIARNNCAAGGTPETVTYTVPAGRYFSYDSQALADSQAQTEINNNLQTFANNNGNCTFWNTSQSGSIARNNCAAGGTPETITYTVPAGRYLSYYSQEVADAQAQAEISNNIQSYANANAKCTFWNVAKSGSIARNNCAAGGTPEIVTYTVPAGRYFSYDSQALADAQAQSEINANVQTFANANGRCTFWNTFKSGSIARNNCAAGGTPETVTYTVPAGIYFSYDSQALADAQAQSEINANVQTFANANGRCTFWNTFKSGSIARNNCAAGGTPETVTYTVPAGRYFSYDSQALADSQAQTEINNNAQAYANANGKCTFWSNVKMASFTKNDCSWGGTPEIVTYRIPAGQYTSTISQSDADSQAQNDSDNNGQAYANANGKCTFYSTALNGSFAKNNCTSGTTGSNVSYSQAAGVVTSTISQADANLNASNKFNIDGQAYANANGVCNAAVITNACTLNFNRVSGSAIMFKNGSQYLTASSSGSYSGTLGTGDTFYVEVSASKNYYKSITITSSVRGTLFMYGPNKIGNYATSATFTKVGSEVITIDCIATDMLD